MNTTVWKTMSALQDRLARNNGLIEAQYQEGYVEWYTCKFREPATDEQIATIESLVNGLLPRDYVDFLRFCNGCWLFDHPAYGGEVHLYGTGDIMAYNDFHENDERISIAYIYGDFIVLDCKDVREGKANCLYVCEFGTPLHQGAPLNCSFATFLDRLIISQGSSFWSWGADFAKRVTEP